MKYKISTISFLFVFLFAFSVANAGNPITDFLFGNSGLIYENTESQPVQQTDNNESTGWLGSGFLSFFSGIFSSIAPETSSSNTQNNDQNIDSQVYENDPGIVDPILTCLPNTVEEDEPFIFLWQCQDSSEFASLSVFGNQVQVGASGFSTGRVSSTTTPKQKLFQISLTCSSGARASCDMNVIHPDISLVADGSVQSGDKANIQWVSVDMTVCELTSDDEDYSSWKRVGTRGSIVSHDITKDTTFKLTCVTKSGLLKTKEITVEVQ